MAWKHIGRADSLHVGPQEEVLGNHARLLKLTAGSIALTERELAVLAVAVTEMIRNGWDPYGKEMVIEVES